MADVVVVMDRPAVDRFRGWTGPLGHSVTRLAKETVYWQKVYGNKRTGAMVGQMHWIKKDYSRGIGFWAGSSAPYTRFVDQGTQPHKILPKQPGGRLVFYWAKIGRVVSLPSVNHPGNKAYKFLQRGLERALGVWNRAG